MSDIPKHILDALPFEIGPKLLIGRMVGKRFDLENQLQAIERLAPEIHAMCGKLVRIERRFGYALVYLDDPTDTDLT